jgi:Tol biopolymer transport system component
MAKQPAPLRRTITLGLVALAGVVVGVVIWSLIPSSPPPQQPLNQFVITPPFNAPLISQPGPDVVISPDGRRIVYVALVDGVRQLYVRELDELISRPISGTEGMSFTPFFSSNGESIAFQAEGKLKQASLLGGPSMTLCEATSVMGGSWFEGTIVFAGITQKGTGLHRVSAAGGEPESLAIVDNEKGELNYRGVTILPQGKTVLATLMRGDGGTQIVALSLETGERKIVLEGGREPYYAPTGHLVYEAARTGTLMAVTFDTVRVEVTGEPTPILEGLRQNDCCTVDYSLSRDGTLVYVLTGAGVRGSLVWVDRDGRESELLTENPKFYSIPRLSPNGQSLAVAIQEQNKRDIWVYEVNRRRRIRLTFEGSSGSPVWTPDSNRVTFNSGSNNDIYWKQADGSGEIELLWESVALLNPTWWSPDGQTLAFFQTDTGLRDIWMLRSEGDASPFLATSFDENSPMFSPDGHWVAYVSDESGRNEVYVQPYPDGGRIVAISNEGGTERRWNRADMVT